MSRAASAVVTNLEPRMSTNCNTSQRVLLRGILSGHLAYLDELHRRIISAIRELHEGVKLAVR
jgi:hypothetical protein